MHKVSMQISGKHLTKATIDKYAKTYRKAVQKEKYRDDAFNIRHPAARISSTIDYENAKVNFTLTAVDYSIIDQGALDVKQ